MPPGAETRGLKMIARTTRTLGIVSTTALATALAATPVLAQTAPSAAEEGIADIVVTAQRREENLQNVPLSVTALSADTLAKNDVRDLSRVEVLTPGFSFGKSGSDARPAIRGVRTENVGVSGDPTIGFFFDNVYRSRASQANEPFVDVARVEVQRGPQGTLYGRNTFGGNVAVESQAPGRDFGGNVNVTLGSFDRRRVDGAINLPVGDAVQFRLAALVEKMGGYIKGTTPALDIANRDTRYVRASVRIAPTEGLEAILRYSYWREKGTGGGAFGYRVGGILVNPATGLFDINGQPFQLRYDLPRNGTPLLDGIPIDQRPLFYPGDTVLEQDLTQHALSANISYDLGPVTLRSITGFIDYEVFRNADNDFSLRLGAVDAQEDKLTSFSQEFQIASSNDSPFQWIAGYFYFKESVSRSIFSSCPTAARNTPGCAFAAGLPTTTSNAVFGQASYWIVPDKVRITGGIRYTDDNKRIIRATATTDTRQRLTAVTPTADAPLNFNFRKTTWRVNGEYHVTDRNMIYATVSTGFRSGGFNAGAFTNPALQGSFGPESVTAYEIGSKNRFLDNKLQFNVSLYRNEFKDLQVQNQFLVPAAGGGTTTTSIILNAARAHSQGIELEVVAVPVTGLNISASATIMEAVYDDYRNTPAPANYTGFVNLTGKQVPYSPKFKATGVVSYDIDLGTAGTLTPQATILYSSSYFNTDFNTVLDRQAAFAKLDLRLGWASAEKNLSLEVFVNNVTDKITLNRGTFGSRGLNTNYDAPRMFGVRGGVKF